MDRTIDCNVCIMLCFFCLSRMEIPSKCTYTLSLLDGFFSSMIRCFSTLFFHAKGTRKKEHLYNYAYINAWQHIKSYNLWAIVYVSWCAIEMKIYFTDSIHSISVICGQFLWKIFRLPLFRIWFCLYFFFHFDCHLVIW